MGNSGPRASTSTTTAPFDLSHILGFHVRHWKDSVAGWGVAGNGYHSSDLDLSSHKAGLPLKLIILFN